jgi:enterochelin esterase-like enzyme
MPRTQLPAAAGLRRGGILALSVAASALGLAPAAGATGACPSTGHRLEAFELPAPALERSKQILVYLPPGHGCDESRRYPVLYFNDGHDLFDWIPHLAELDPPVAAEIAAREAWYGSWHLDGQLDRAIAAGELPPLIVAGIAADDGMRSRDLAPVPWRGSAEARGIAYGRFVAEDLVALVDARYPTLPDRRCRAIAGASLGGVSALQIGLAHADRFALVLAFSPVLGDPAIAGHLAAAWRAPTAAGPSRLLVDVDDDPLGSADRQWLGALVGAAPPGREVALVQTPGGRHAIASWAERVMPALARLLDGACPG